VRQESLRNLALRGAVADMVFILDSEGRYVGFFPGEGAQPLVPPELFLGRRVNEVLPVEVARQAMSAINAAVQTQQLQVINYELWEGDTFRQYECRIVASGSDEVVALVRDSSARRFHLTRQERWQERQRLDIRAQRAVSGQNPYSLTFREFTVLDLMQDGMDDRNIARTLGLSRNNIVQHVASIFGKLKASSRTEAAVKAMRQHLIPESD
jgi:DNA-binding CsgD family transcriptional regulator